MEKVIIAGTGCAGLTAAIYTARASLNPLVLEGCEPGGQLTTTTMVENFPGFPDGIDGPQLIMNMHRQAEKFGAKFRYAEVLDFEAKNGHYRLKVDDEWVETESVIIASGASAKWLGLENEPRLKGHGLTSCATCDGAFYRNVPVCVIGGGDTAAEEAAAVVQEAGAEAVLVRGNVADERTVEELASKGPYKVVVHNAATGVVRPALETEDKHWDWTLAANARALLSLARATAPAMEPGGSMALSSTRLTRIPHLPVASSSTPRSPELICSRLVRVSSRSMPPTMLRSVVMVSCSIAWM